MEDNGCCISENLGFHHNKKIIIIGAGISGISCAVSLRRLGFSDVSILEARSRVGGRIETVSDDSHFIEMGAQWIHGEQKNIIHEIADNNCSINSKPEHYLSDIFSFQHFPEEKKRLISLLVSYLFEKMETIDVNNTSLLSYLEKNFREYMIQFHNHPLKDCLHAAFDWFCKFQCELQGCQCLSLVSAKLLNSYKECDGNQTLEVARGYSSIIDLFVENLPSSCILKNHHVIQVDWSDFFKESEKMRRVKVVCENKEIYFADHVIITLPLGCLKKNNQSFFNPSLSDRKQQAIQCLGFDVVNKIYLKFPFPFWKADAVFNVVWDNEFDNYFSDEDPSVQKVPSDYWVKDINRFAHTSHPNMLCAWITGKGAVTMELLSDQKIMDDCMKLLKIILKVDLHYTPLKILRSSWFSDQFSCGSYSYLSVECEKRNISNLDIAEPEYSNFPCSEHPVLIFAGEATHPHYYSTIHGASETGFFAAQRLFEHYGNKKMPFHVDLDTLHLKMTEMLTFKTSLCRNLKVIIIGAGIAGLACASHLAKNYFSQICILEAQPKIGGRVHSVNYGDSFLELGAQWIHGTQNKLYEFSKQHNLISDMADELSYEGKGVFCTSAGRKIESQIVAEVKLFLDNEKAKLEKGCYASVDNKSPINYFTAAFNSYLENSNNESDIAIKQGLFNWYIRFEVIDNACDCLDTISAKSYTEWKDCDGDDILYHINIDNGFYSLIDVLSNKKSNDNIPRIKLCDNIYTNKPVKTIKWHKNFEQVQHKLLMNPRSNDSYPVTVECENGENFIADCVVVTTSIGFLKENCNTFFCPELPADKHRALEHVDFGTINKIYLVYEEAFWSSEDHGIQLVWLEEISEDCQKLLDKNPWIRGITGFDTVLKQPKVLLGWIGGTEAKMIEEVEPDVISSVCTELLRIFLNRPDIPSPVKIFRSQWFKNPYIRGAYSSRKMSYYDNDSTLHDLQYPLCSTYRASRGNSTKWPTVLFAGEAFDEHCFSSAHGAFQSGIKAADSLINACSCMELYEKPV